MKLFAYMTRGARTSEPDISLTSKKAIALNFRLLNAKQQTQFFGTAFFRQGANKKEATRIQPGKDAFLPLTEFGSLHHCQYIQYWINDSWQDI